MTEHIRNVSRESQQNTWQVVMEAGSCLKAVVKPNHALLQNQIPLMEVAHKVVEQGDGGRIQCSSFTGRSSSDSF